MMPILWGLTEVLIFILALALCPMFEIDIKMWHELIPVQFPFFSDAEVFFVCLFSHVTLREKIESWVTYI